MTEARTNSETMDIVSPAQRSKMMGRIRRSGTKPEIAVRKAARDLKVRYYVNRKTLPGRPDLVFPKTKTAVFVHGCFWHRHDGCKYCYIPKSKVEFWQDKFNKNVARDQRVKEELQRMGWRVATIWECETSDASRLSTKLEVLLDT